LLLSFLGCVDVVTAEKNVHDGLCAANHARRTAWRRPMPA
jgi:hypothetical protein